MRTLWLQTGFELKLIAKLRWTLLLPPAAGLWMLFQCADIGLPASMDVNLYAADAHSTLMTFLTALPMFLGVLLIRRDALNPSYEWSLTLPVTNRVMIAAKWIAGMLYSSAFTACILAVYAGVAVHHKLSWRSILSEIAHYAPLYETSFAAGVAVGIVIGALFPMRFALPVAFCGWIFGSIFVPVYLIEVFDWHILRLFSLNHLIGDLGAGASEAWAYRLSGVEYPLTYAFAGTVTVLVLAAACALLARTRPVVRPLAPIALMVAALIAACAVYTPYAELWQQRYAQWQQLMPSVPEAELTRPHAPYAFKVASMDVRLDRADDDTFAARAEIVLPTQDGRLLPAHEGQDAVTDRIEGRVVFLLYPKLRVTGLTVDGAQVPWMQEQDRISFDRAALAPSADAHKIVWNYAAVSPLNEWAHDGSGQYHLLFSQGESSFLPAYLGWYPIPGGDSLMYHVGKQIVPRADVASGLHTDFRLRLTGFAGRIVATLPAAEDDRPGSRSFAGQNAALPTVVGGSFTAVKMADEPALMLTTPGNVEESRIFLENLGERRAFYERWTGARLDRIRQIVYFPFFGTFDRSYGLTSVFPIGDTLFIGELRHSNLDTYRMEQTINFLLFGDTVYTSDWVNNWDDQDPDRLNNYSIVQEIRRMIALYIPMKEGVIAQEDVHMLSPIGEKMKQMVDTAYEQGKADVAKRVLMRFWNDGLTIEDQTSAGTASSVASNAASPYDYPFITWEQWLQAWYEEKGR
ncbi:hypothetical protein ACFFSY_30700 [Paenibacillus aurantiacus]|uniref:ABC transporter permease n=1 Tax=Paenibacillus aurantiacus TaxID=1936118 RepID=A0ABV5L222_9BACL